MLNIASVFILESPNLTSLVHNSATLQQERTGITFVPEPMQQNALKTPIQCLHIG
jgi:hypothetical protein